MQFRAWSGVAIVTAVLSLPVLFVGLLSDDLIHRIALSGEWAPYRRGVWSLYEFNRGGSENAPLFDAGVLPWFSNPEQAIRFFRPISSALVALDVQLFGNTAVLPHAHSLAWFAVVVYFAWKIHRALLPERAASFATLIFAIAGAHAEALSWLAARHVIVGGAFGLAAWHAQIRWLELRQHWRGLLSAALLSLGLAASESTLSVVPFMLGYAVFGRGGALGKRLVSALPAASIALGYLVFYAALGYGTRHVGGYVSPFESPVRFATSLAEQLPLALAQAFTAVPVVLAHGNDALLRALWALGLASTGFVVWAAFFDQRERSAGERRLFWLPWALFGSLAPTASTIIVAGRVLLVPLVGASLLIGLLLARATAGAAIRDGVSHARTKRSLSRWAGRAGVGALLAMHLGLSPAVRLATELHFARVSRSERDLMARARFGCDHRARHFLINGADPMIGMYSGILLYFAGYRESPGWHVLSMAPNDLTLERSGPRSFTLSTVGARHTHLFEQLQRPSFEPLRVGDRVELSSFSANVLAAAPNGPTRVRFDLDRELDAADICFVRWKGGATGHLESVTLPKTGTLRVLHGPGPSAI